MIIVKLNGIDDNENTISLFRKELLKNYPNNKLINEFPSRLKKLICKYNTCNLFIFESTNDIYKFFRNENNIRYEQTENKKYIDIDIYYSSVVVEERSICIYEVKYEPLIKEFIL